jgi:hypothetical protein
VATGRKTPGRRKGTPNRATTERQLAIAASGTTPLAIMLENARWAHAQATQLTDQLAKAEPSLNTAELLREIIRFRGLAAEWAHLAAPYVHQKWTAVGAYPFEPPTAVLPSMWAGPFRLKRGLAAEWAHLAAPYVHPRLAAVAHRHAMPMAGQPSPLLSSSFTGTLDLRALGLASRATTFQIAASSMISSASDKGDSPWSARHDGPPRFSDGRGAI